MHPGGAAIDLRAMALPLVTAQLDYSFEGWIGLAACECATSS
jgi:hypothetical protein